MVTLTLAAGCGRSGAALPRRPNVVQVDMTEYHFGYHADFHSGRTVIQVRNRGELVHEMVLIALPADGPPLEGQLHSGTRVVVPTVASLHQRAPGHTGTFAVDLDAGRYAFVCFVQDPDGVQHALKGMNSEFTVK